MSILQLRYSVSPSKQIKLQTQIQNEPLGIIFKNIWPFPSTPYTQPVFFLLLLFFLYIDPVLSPKPTVNEILKIQDIQYPTYSQY